MNDKAFRYSKRYIYQLVNHKYQSFSLDTRQTTPYAWWYSMLNLISRLSNPLHIYSPAPMTYLLPLPQHMFRVSFLTLASSLKYCHGPQKQGFRGPEQVWSSLSSTSKSGLNSTITPTPHLYPTCVKEKKKGLSIPCCEEIRADHFRIAKGGSGSSSTLQLSYVIWYQMFCVDIEVGHSDWTEAGRAVKYPKAYAEGI